ncbi:DUF3427 domain-containing protein [uncultured Faecalibaculum sp.]|uniref:DUF3427 domain-containing protein n=2 Tax=uncultured Faecalibaculum sp. TaxID=1729681 RepID=UPI0025D86918|nr:DUF3427 domain-containing protein [uncultured Faecalibaculum sp.]
MNTELETRIMNAAKAGLVNAAHPADKDCIPELLYNDCETGEKVFCALEQELARCDAFCFSTAFITIGGLEALKPILRTLQEKGIPGRILTTDYLAFSEPAALDFLDSFDNIEVRMYMSTPAQGFHTKGYLFFRQDQVRLITGSSNLTASALLANREWNTRLTGMHQGQYVLQVLEQFRKLYDSVDSLPWSAVRQDYIISHELARKQQETALLQKSFSPAQYQLKPNAMQSRFVRSLTSLMEAGQQRALLISATGTGKTYAAAFAVRQFMPRRILFLVHREQIARKALASFRTVIGNRRTFGMLGGGRKELEADYLFSTVQTLSRVDTLHRLDPGAFDWIIIDEVHRAAAGSYLRIFDHFRPQFWLGMSTTPARTDGQSIFDLFDHNVAAQISLQQALEEDLLCPFHYFALSGLEISDETLEDPQAFSALTSDERVRHIAEEAAYYGWSGSRVMGLMFVSGIREAAELSQKLNARGLRTLALSGADSQEDREDAIRRLTGPQGPDALDYLITVDIFNEGVDIPEVNQVLLLRPTQSAIVFTQQLGRGLRKSAGKEFVVVLDFIGLYKNNYLIPAALSGSTGGSKDALRRFVTEGSRTLPGVSTVHFDEVARRRIFASIDQARMNSSKALKDGFQQLRDRLGRIPALTDYDPAQAMDPLLIFSNSAYPSYPDFLQKILEPVMRDKLPVYTPEQLEFLRFISQQWAGVKRPLEPLLLQALLHDNWQEVFRKSLKDRNIRLSEQDWICLKKQFCREWLAGSGSKSWPAACFLIAAHPVNTEPADSTDTADAPEPMLLPEDLTRTPAWIRALENPAFVQEIRELTAFALNRWDSRYRALPRDGWLIRYQPYTYAESFRAMSFPACPVAQNVGGYCHERTTHQFPVYINYEKAPDIADTIQYEDHFTSPQTLIALSKSRRTLQSNDIRTLQKAGETGLQIPLFVRKNTNDSTKEFICLGLMKPDGQFMPTLLPDGRTRAVKIGYELEHPVRPDLYAWFTQSSVE